MNRLATYLLFVVSGALLGAMCSVVNGMLAENLSPEYFPVYFKAWDINYHTYGGLHKAVLTTSAVSGAKAGSALALLTGLVAFIFPDPWSMRKVLVQVILIGVACIVVSYTAGYFSGKSILKAIGMKMNAPDEVTDGKMFKRAAAMQRMQAVAWALVFLISVIYMVVQKRRWSKRQDPHTMRP
jgi:hypothetical protein